MSRNGSVVISKKRFASQGISQKTEAPVLGVLVFLVVCSLMGKTFPEIGRSKIGLVVIMCSARVLAVRSDNEWKDGGIFAM
jgi:hypothetical protein